MVGVGLALTAMALAAVPARAQISRPVGEVGERTERRGIYLGVGGDVGLQFVSGVDTKFSYGGQAKLGYSLTRQLQIYLAGALHHAAGYSTPGFPESQTLILATAHLHQFIYQDRGGLGVFVDGGVGAGFVTPGVGITRALAIGIGYSGGLGIEIPITSYVSLVPEFYYRSVNNATAENVSITVNVIGLQLGVVYY